MLEHGIIPQLLDQCMYSIQCRKIKPGRTLFVPFSAFGSAECPVHILEINYFLKVGHTTQSFFVYPCGKVVRSFDGWCMDFGLLPTLSNCPPVRANAVVVVVVVVVDVAGRRNTKKNTTHNLCFY